MVRNPERENFDRFENICTRNPYPFAAVDRIVTWTLHGEMEAISENPSTRQYFQNLLRSTHLYWDTRSILRNLLVYGDAYVRLVRDNEENIVRLHHLSPKDVEIMLDNEGNVTEFSVTFGDETVSYPPHEVMHFRWVPQEGNPYGVSLMKGLEQYVEMDNRIMDAFLKAFQAQARREPVIFDSTRNLRILKAIPYAIAAHTKVPIGLLKMNIEDETSHRFQMEKFEKRCQSLRDILRNEIMQKIIQPEIERRSLEGNVSIGWKRRSKPSLSETEYIMSQLELGIITLEEAKKQFGLTEYYV